MKPRKITKSDLVVALRAAAELIYLTPELFVIEAVTEAAGERVGLTDAMAELIFSDDSHAGWGGEEHRVLYVLFIAEAIEAGALSP